MSTVKKLNELRVEAVKDGKTKLAIGIQRVMMANFQEDAHKLLAGHNAKGLAEIKEQGKKEGKNRFYQSRSGEDVSGFVAELNEGPKPKKTTRTVAPSPAALDIVKQNTVAVLSAMEDEELTKTFGSLAVEKAWLKSEGFNVHPNAKEESTRKRTRGVFAELLQSDEEE